MDCILHIGIEKTGTTAIQRFLDTNRQTLLEEGWLYPRLTGYGDHAPVCVASYQKYRKDDLCKYSQVMSEQEWLGYRKELQNVIRAEIQEAEACGATRMLISSEHIQSRLTDPEELRNLKGLLEESGLNRISILIYLRDPVEIASSLYSTAVKFGSKLPTIPPPDNPYYRNVCDHRATLKRFEDVFGIESLHVRLFDKTAFPQGSVVMDFLDALGISPERHHFPEGSTNRSLSAVGIAILARLNGSIPVFVEDGYNQLRQRLIDFLEQNYHYPPYCAPREILEQYEATFLDSNEWVRKRYFPNLPALFPKAVKQASLLQQALPDSELDRLAAEIVERLREWE